MHVCTVRLRNLRVALDHLDIGVPQHLLKREHIPAVAQVRDREAVAKTMRMHIFHGRAHVTRCPVREHSLCINRAAEGDLVPELALILFVLIWLG